MYNNDGTRGSFNSKPFTLKIFSTSGEPINDIDETKITWTASWDSQPKTGNGITFSPPALFDS